MAIRTYDPAPTLTPQQRLAIALGGEIIGPDSIRFGDHVATAYLSGKVRIGRVVVGDWDDPTHVLAAECRRVAGVA